MTRHAGDKPLTQAAVLQGGHTSEDRQARQFRAEHLRREAGHSEIHGVALTSMARGGGERKKVSWKLVLQSDTSGRRKSLLVAPAHWGRLRVERDPVRVDRAAASASRTTRVLRVLGSPWAEVEQTEVLTGDGVAVRSTLRFVDSGLVLRFELPPRAARGQLAFQFTMAGSKEAVGVGLVRSRGAQGAAAPGARGNAAVRRELAAGSEFGRSEKSRAATLGRGGPRDPPARGKSTPGGPWPGAVDAGDAPPGAAGRDRADRGSGEAGGAGPGDALPPHMTPPRPRGESMYDVALWVPAAPRGAAPEPPPEVPLESLRARRDTTVQVALSRELLRLVDAESVLFAVSDAVYGELVSERERGRMARASERVSKEVAMGHYRAPAGAGAGGAGGSAGKPAGGWGGFSGRKKSAGRSPGGPAGAGGSRALTAMDID